MIAPLKQSICISLSYILKKKIINALLLTQINHKKARLSERVSLKTHDQSEPNHVAYTHRSKHMLHV